jgi:hypothetical protein
MLGKKHPMTVESTRGSVMYLESKREAWQYLINVDWSLMGWVITFSKPDGISGAM